MNQMITIVRTKITLLQAFHQYSVDFLQEITNGDLSGLDQFEARRNQCLEVILSGDKKIAEIAKGIAEKEKTTALLHVLGELSRRSDHIFSEIIQIDAKIIEKLSQEKDQLKGRLTDFNRNEKLVRKFKSSWIPNSGDKLDGSL